MRFHHALLALASGILLLATAARADHSAFAGKYSDGSLSVDLAQSSGGYAGTITLHDQEYPAQAHESGSGLDGTFTAGNNSFPFNASLNGDTLTLLSAGTTYTLKRLSPANPLVANPLAGNPPPGSPPPANAPGGDAPPGYTVEASNASGKSLITQKPGLSTIADALVATFSDLAVYFGSRPTVGASYQDAKDPSSGGATFGAKYNGKNIRGFISCKIDEGAKISVIFLQADAPKADWEALMAHTAAAAISPVPLKEYDFPDGTGSIGLADGWTTQAPSIVTTAVFSGPAGQSIVLQDSRNINTPDSAPAQMYQRHLQQMAQHYGPGNPMSIYNVPVEPVLISPLTDPGTALSVLFPQFNAISQFRHGPTLELNQIISSREVPTSFPGGKAGIVTFDYTTTANGQATTYRERAFIIAFPVQTGLWAWNCPWNVHGPVATFDRDLPSMMAMVNSEQGNPQRIEQVVEAIIKQTFDNIHRNLDELAKRQREQYEQYQRDQQSRQQIHDAQMAQTQAGYDQINQEFKDHELARSRGDADKVEAILGTRMVYDTVTGESGYANLTDVTSVVDSLNQAALDPNRFVQVPLRDQLYPMPPGR